jgi:HPt (histidine-containing phosphotransfer) domain-containing protein
VSSGFEVRVDAAVLDPAALAVLRDLVGGDPAFVRELVSAFLEDVPARMAEIRSGVESADAVLVQRAAHTLKGNGATFGALLFAEACRNLEETAKSGSVEDAAPMTLEIERTWAHARPALEALAGQAAP